MNVVVLSEYRFQRDGAGRLVSSSRTRGYSFWKRYLRGFGSVSIVARVDDEQGIDGEYVEDDGVRVFAVPGYKGVVQLANGFPTVRDAIVNTVSGDSSVILRLPGALGTIAYRSVRALGKPYGVELVGDPYDVFAPGAVHHPLRPLLRTVYSSATRRQVRNASGVAYVTEHALQKRYPCSSLRVAASSVDLPENAYCRQARIHGRILMPLTLVTVGSLSQPYKGVDVLLAAVRQLRRSDLDIRLRVIGDGTYRAALETKAVQLGVADRVDFLGRLPAGDAVRAELDRADIFVLASRTEGLPRAMIEAMARGLPCIGTQVGGIPELLPNEFLVPVNDSSALAEKIRVFIDVDSSVIAAVSARNLEVARRYHQDILNERRNSFYSHIRAQTEAWLQDNR